MTYIPKHSLKPRAQDCKPKVVKTQRLHDCNLPKPYKALYQLCTACLCISASMYRCIYMHAYVYVYEYAYVTYMCKLESEGYGP